jgi:hypothetical protein
MERAVTAARAAVELAAVAEHTRLVQVCDVCGPTCNTRSRAACVR